MLAVDYIEKQKPLQKAIIKRLRSVILKVFPKIEQEMKWGALVFGGGTFYLVGLRDSVNLGFSVTGISKSEMDIFNGKGKLMRHLKFRSLEDVDEKKIIGLLKMVHKKAKCSGVC